MSEKVTEIMKKLEDSLEMAKDFTAEFAKGKKIAGGRIRKEAQNSKKLWQDLRTVIMDELKAMPTKKRS